MFNDEAEDTLYFELTVDEWDLGDSDFRLDENNETFADMELEEEVVLSFPFETKQAVVEY